MADVDDPIVGHKTLLAEPGNDTGFRHAPLRKSEADAIMRQVEAEEARRLQLMPTEQTAINLFFDAWYRLTKDFGWRQMMYAPRNGEPLEFIEAGSTGIHRGHRQGNYCNIEADNDLWPSEPTLWRPVAVATASALGSDQPSGIEMRD